MPARVTRWSLLAVLLVCGIALMHTLGHPAIGAGDAGMHSRAAPAGQHGSALRHQPSPQRDLLQHAAPVPHGAPASHVALASHGVPASHGAPVPRRDPLFAASYPVAISIVALAPVLHLPTPGPHGMDPSLMCLAVLTALLSAGAVIALLRYRDRTARPGPAPAPSGRAVRGPPPPRSGPALVRLSVLRI
ncbi:hypothetical protein [Actinocatenispora comari]|uniref:Uncharacterized protein n=1 Tax=Actinocatenispora comari TaxID=2807577 RepID=A0A8J4EPM6_9ACTN|nr:hypothetical protein [Actinocatenispora comari]GIL30968.1 hypothetical protein NUM_62220 [Actinocatenispora comari]